MGKAKLGLGLAIAAWMGVGCLADSAEPSGADEEAFSSAEARLVDFVFDGEVVGASSTNLKGQIRAQLLYTVGHLNAEPGVSHLPKLSLTNVTSTSIGGGLYRIGYHATLPVAWGNRSRVPSTYTLTLPRRVGSSSESAFVDAYSARCADDPASSNASNYWYHYRPNASGCSIPSSDVVQTTARVTVSSKNTSGKYPEYRRVWEDGILRIVAIFGKEQEGATADSDPGIAGYNAFVSSMMDALRGAETTPPNVGGSPGVSAPEVTLELSRADGTRVEATVLLVDKLASVGPAFDRRYAELSAGADLIMYNGHAGLGGNVRALAEKGKFFPGKYQVFFFNGCDTLAYIDETLAQKRALLNPDDPSGTRYMDVLTNAMPAYFNAMSDASMRLVKALLSTTSPKTYETIFSQMDAQQIVVVNGEEDNTFMASASPVLPRWGFTKTGAVRKGETVSYETEVLQAGTYVFALMPDPGIAGGDADLRVRAGGPPTLTPEFKCPSYVANSNERCTLTLSSPAKVHVAVTGDSSEMASPFELRVFRPE
jgi:hypothetical protein